MNDLYLILHKVRGEPAFDIAQRLRIGNEDGWIIPTSGHRAHPFMQWLLTELVPDPSGGYYTDVVMRAKKLEMPANLPDHYAINDAKAVPSRALRSSGTTLEDLGL